MRAAGSSYRPPTVKEFYANPKSTEFIEDLINRTPLPSSADDFSIIELTENYLRESATDREHPGDILKCFAEEKLRELALRRYPSLSLNKEAPIDEVASLASGLLLSRGLEPPACRMIHEDKVQSRYFS